MRVRPVCSGISLVEVLVSLALLTIATLALSMMSAHARMTGSAAAKQQAGWRLIAELAVWLRLRGDKPLGGLPEDPSSLLAKSTADCYSKRCDPVEAAEFYLADWYRRLSTSVPGARLVVCRDDQPWDATAGRWRWQCNGNSASPLWLKLGWPQPGAIIEFAPQILLKPGTGG